MKKKLIVLLVVLCMALGAGTTLTAFAGVNQNSPTGDGLMTGGGDLIQQTTRFATTTLTIRHTATKRVQRFTICQECQPRTMFLRIK